MKFFSAALIALSLAISGCSDSSDRSAEFDSTLEDASPFLNEFESARSGGASNDEAYRRAKDKTGTEPTFD